MRLVVILSDRWISCLGTARAPSRGDLQPHCDTSTPHVEGSHPFQGYTNVSRQSVGKVDDLDFELVS